MQAVVNSCCKNFSLMILIWIDLYLSITPLLEILNALIACIAPSHTTRHEKYSHQQLIRSFYLIIGTRGLLNQQPNAVETLSQKGFTLTRLILLSAAAAEEIRHASLKCMPAFQKCKRRNYTFTFIQMFYRHYSMNLPKCLQFFSKLNLTSTSAC